MQHPAFTKTDHRPWEMPKGSWTWRQSWCDLLFAHWPIPARVLQPLVPAQLTVQEFDSTSWIGVVPFRMRGVMRRPLPDLPWISAFPELNLRIYVEHGGKPGVWFLSLDATNILAVWAARRFFSLPYYWAKMKIKERDGTFSYTSDRKREAQNVQFRATYRPTSEPYHAQAGSLEHWLTERYCLYSQSPSGEVFRAEVHHHPWPLQRAEAEIATNTLLTPFRLDVLGEPHLLHFSRNIDVVVWSPVAV